MSLATDNRQNAVPRNVVARLLTGLYGGSQTIVLLERTLLFLETYTETAAKRAILNRFLAQEKRYQLALSIWTLLCVG